MEYKHKNNPYIYKGLAFVCPDCGEYPNVACAVIFKAVTRLDVPYFLCSKCGLGHMSLSLIDDRATQWKKDDQFIREPLSLLKREVRWHMQEIQKDCEKIGYHFMRFKRLRIR